MESFHGNTNQKTDTDANQSIIDFINNNSQRDPDPDSLENETVK